MEHFEKECFETEYGVSGIVREKKIPMNRFLSEAQLRFVTNTASGMGLIKCGSVVIPFDNQISKDTDLYRLYNTNIHEKIAMMKKEKLPEKVIERSGGS